MGLRIIYGKAGSGKSEYIYNEIEYKNNNKKIYIITPEQYSFTAEQKLMKNKKAVIGTEVITFNRLAYRVLNEYGGVIHTNITKCGKAMLIYSILQAEKNNLIFLNKTDENIELCMRIISELKKHAVYVNDLKKIKEHTQDKYLKTKLEDIILIYEKYQEKIQNNYIDETDLLSMLAENIDKVDILKNATVYIDEFVGFTEQEYSIIRKIIEIANSVTITMCVDNLNFDTNPGIDIFYPNKVTLKKIINLLDKNSIIEKIELKEQHRFKNNELKSIEKNLYNIKPKKATNDGIIKMFLAKNYYTEIEYIAKQILKLVKEEKMRYKDISIITKNIETYSSLTKTIFKKYNIPVFIDEKRDLNQNIIVQYILAILEIYGKNFSYESVFNYLKLGFLNNEDYFKLEKYCIKYGIKNNKFKKDFIFDMDEKETEYLNEQRKQIIEPLIDLKDKIDQNKTVKNISKELYQFIQEQYIEEKIKNKIKELEDQGYVELAKEYEESYKIIINILDEMNLIFGEEKITLDKFRQIFKIGIKNSGLGKIPGTQDQVIMGDIDRSRSRKTKAVFIIGLNDGVFPSIIKKEGFLDDNDREHLKNEGLEIAKGTLENLYDENFNIYKAFTTAEEKMFLTYSSSDNEGKSLRASNIIFRIKKIFPELSQESDVVGNNLKLEITNEQKLYEDLIIKTNEIKDGKSPEDLFYTVFEYYRNNNKYDLKNNIEYINYNFYENITTENIEKLYGNKIRTSVSKLEKYKSCPFSYYMEYILKLKEQEELKVQSIDTGSFMHEVIDEFFEFINSKDISIKNISNEEIEKIINKIIDEKLCKKNYYIFTATEKYRLLVTRLKRIIIKSLKYIIQTLTQSKFDLAGTEVQFAENGKYKPIELILDNGKKVEITGKIDRIDIAKDENKKYVRIIDYKSSVKNIDFGNIYAGLQLQLITYLDAVCKIEDLIPVGILYFNLLEQIINSNKKINEEEIERKIKNNFKMKGLILADVKIAKMQDKNLESGSSEIIPAYIDKTGTLSPKKSSIATQEEFSKLQNYINKTIKEISNEIFKGNIELKPYYKNKKTPCEYCNYRNICGFNSGVCKKNYRYINNLNKEEFFNKIN